MTPANPRRSKQQQCHAKHLMTATVPTNVQRASTANDEPTKQHSQCQTTHEHATTKLSVSGIIPLELEAKERSNARTDPVAASSSCIRLRAGSAARSTAVNLAIFLRLIASFSQHVVIVTTHSLVCSLSRSLLHGMPDRLTTTIATRWWVFLSGDPTRSVTLKSGKTTNRAINQPSTMRKLKLVQGTTRTLAAVKGRKKRTNE